MIISQEEFFCFYVQDIVNHCNFLKEKILHFYTVELSYLSDKEIREKAKCFLYDIEEVLEFVTSLPKIYTTRCFIFTGANNDQVIIEKWNYLKETFQEYMDKIANYLKIYYENIGVFLISGKIDETLNIKIKEKIYNYTELNNLFGLALNYLFDVSPLVYYDKFKYSIR
jgi:hypothetical protein